MNKAEQLTLSPDIWSGKTYPERSAPTKGKTSKPCLKKQSELSKKSSPIFLSLLEGGTTQELLWETDSALLGEFSTRSFGERPSVVVESHLSQILEEQPHPKYSLSAKACQGILCRAKHRGKSLPPLLMNALERQIQMDLGANISHTALVETL